MSLFKARDIWSTHCGDDETFDSHCIVVANLNGLKDSVIVGSHSGYLRVYQPSTARKEISNDGVESVGYNPGDLLIEMQLASPILQAAVGKLVSGSRGLHLCFLLPRSVAVYSLATKAGATEHGNQNRLTLVYEHQLRRSAFCMVIGPFGGTQGRDFICVQSLDGTLAFYEQETFSFIQYLPAFLLPGPLAYQPSTDSFITVSSSLFLESYKYQSLADARDSTDQESLSKKKIMTEWSHNLGEPALDIQVLVSADGNSSYIMILGERNLFCLLGSGSLKFMKRLEYKPCCFYPYLTETDERVMTLVTSDTNTLLVYDYTTLRWSSQLLLAPVAVTRGNFEVPGVLVLLSETGQLQCCYLGTEPSLFLTPPLETHPIDYKASSQELEELQKTIFIYSKANSVKLANTASERELSISALIGPHLEPCAFKTNREDDRDNTSSEEPFPMCRVMVKLLPHAPLNKVQVSIIVEHPLEVNQSSHTIASLCNMTQVNFFVYHADEKCDIPTLNVKVVTSYMTANLIPRVNQTEVQLPLTLVAGYIAPEKEADFKLTININQPPATLSEIFPEFLMEGALASGSTSTGFRYLRHNQCCASILIAKSSQRYRLQSNSMASLCLFTTELVSRLKKYFSKQKAFSCSYTSSLPVHELVNQIDAHFTLRQQSRKLQEDLGLRASQFRLIQRRLLTKFKDKTPRPLANLDMLLKDTHTQIITFAKALECNQEALVRASCQLSCVLKLMFVLLKLMNVVTEEDCNQLEAAVSSAIHDTENQGWEEVTEAALSHILRTILVKSSKDQHNSKAISLEVMNDSSRLKKHIGVVFDRITKFSYGRKSRDENIASIPETVEEEVSLPIGSQFGERLLSATAQRNAGSLLSARRKLAQDVQMSARQQQHLRLPGICHLKQCKRRVLIPWNVRDLAHHTWCSGYLLLINAGESCVTACDRVQCEPSDATSGKKYSGSGELVEKYLPSTSIRPTFVE